LYGPQKTDDGAIFWQALSAHRLSLPEVVLLLCPSRILFDVLSIASGDNDLRATYIIVQSWNRWQCIYYIVSVLWKVLLRQTSSMYSL